MRKALAVILVALAACEEPRARQQVVNVPIPNAEGTPGAALQPIVVEQPAQHSDNSWLWGLGGYLLGRNTAPSGGGYQSPASVNHYHHNETRPSQPPKVYSAPSYTRPSVSRPSSPSVSRPSSPSFSRPSYSRPSFGGRR